MPFVQRVGCAIIAIIYFYEHFHAFHGEDASTIGQETLDERANTAVALALQMERDLVRGTTTTRPSQMCAVPARPR